MQKIALCAAIGMFGFAGVTLADPAPNPNSNQGCVAQATLAYKAAGYPIGSTGQVISDRNTNPDNTYYASNNLSGRGDEVSSLAQSCKGPD